MLIIYASLGIGVKKTSGHIALMPAEVTDGYTISLFYCEGGETAPGESAQSNKDKISIKQYFGLIYE